MPKYELQVPVTVRVAREWLAANAEENRRPKRSKVPAYTRDMIAGKWREDTGETIKFDPDGVLIDGQNRLLAVIASNGGPRGYIKFDVARDVPREAMLVLDTGAARTFADNIRVSSREYTRAASIVRWVLSWNAGVPMNSGNQSRWTHSELVEVYREEPLLYEEAARRGGDAAKLGLGSVSAVGTGYVVLHRIDAEQCKQLFDQVIGGANLTEKHPALLLRNRLSRIKVDRITPPEVLALYIRTWNLIRRDVTPKSGKIIIARGELNNENFPRPVRK